MTLRLEGGSLLLVSGQLAASADCCCGEVPCSCTVVKSGPCKCVNGAYGDDRDVPDMLVTIGGTLPLLAAPGSGACSDPRGTYLISCGDDYAECFDNIDPAKRIALRFEYSKGGIVVSVVSAVTNCASPVFVGAVQWLFDFTIVDDWQYIPSASCREECNSTVDNWKCADQLDWILTDNVSGSTPAPGQCDLSGLTVSLAAT